MAIGFEIVALYALLLGAVYKARDVVLKMSEEQLVAIIDDFEEKVIMTSILKITSMKIGSSEKQRAAAKAGLEPMRKNLNLVSRFRVSKDQEGNLSIATYALLISGLVLTALAVFLYVPDSIIGVLLIFFSALWGVMTLLFMCVYFVHLVSMKQDVVKLRKAIQESERSAE